MKKLTFEHTRKQWLKFVVDQRIADEIITLASDQEMIDYGFALEENAIWDLQEALFKDTSDRNSRAGAHQVHWLTIKQWIGR